jgi:hypothetical protein
MMKPGYIVALIVAVTIGVASPALAASTAKKLTYEEAWQHCKALLDKERSPGTTTAGNWRMIRGGACMKKYGYTL